MLPVVPPGAGNSPYSSTSAFAGSELLVSPEDLVADGFLSRSDLEAAGTVPESRADYEAARRIRLPLLRKAYASFKPNADFTWFVKAQRDWLDDYALFRAMNDAQGGAKWIGWPKAWRDRDAKTLRALRGELAEGFEFHRFVQWQFDVQWRRLREHAGASGVGLIGDAPIFVEHDSADVWAHRELFQLDREGAMTAVAGVPPDYFSATGQRWGNPLYRWKGSAIAWWVDRITHLLERFDVVRLDHFIGFHRAWAIPPEEPTAMNGTWQKGPGARLFQALWKSIGGLPLIAEDLGILIPPVVELRNRFELPGLRILQFAFGDGPETDTFKPFSYPRRCVVYTGTHDNDTIVGWFRSEHSAADREQALAYFGTDGREIHWDMIRAALSSVADTALIPLQDVLGLGNDARMNRPGVASGNWEWRFSEAQLTPDVVKRMRGMSESYGRVPRTPPAEPPPPPPSALPSPKPPTARRKASR
jgi:4-alpha-glucanotransferase